MIFKHTLMGFGLVICITAAVLAGAQDSSGSGAPAHKPVAAPKAVLEGNGDVIWEQQCSRCHSAPQGFSPRISGTVIRHMRVRASLSRHDEQELLKFLNP